MSDRPGESYTLPALLEITEAQGNANLRLGGPRMPEVSYPGAIAWDEMEHLGEQASEELSSVSEACGALTLSEEKRDWALQKLRSIGTMLLCKILGKYMCTWHEGTTSLGPGTLTWGPGNPPMMDVKISCNDCLVVPAEILPLANPVGSGPQAGLEDAVALVGFGASCHRPTTAPRAPADEALLNPQALRFYWHADLKGAREQWKWLAKRFDTEGPHPANGEDSRVVADLIVFKGRDHRKPITVAVEHFHCHHERRGDKPTAQPDVMRLKARSRSFSISKLFSIVTEVKIHADQLLRLGTTPAAGLVFLNACSSHLVSPRAVGSFARDLLLNGRNAVVTTWSDVPDDVAFAIACYFYEALLRGDTVGASLREARVRLLLDKKNPLGLLYTVYGDSQFRLVGISKSTNKEG